MPSAILSCETENNTVANGSGNSSINSIKEMTFSREEKRNTLRVIYGSYWRKEDKRQSNNRQTEALRSRGGVGRGGTDQRETRGGAETDIPCGRPCGMCLANGMGNAMKEIGMYINWRK